MKYLTPLFPLPVGILLTVLLQSHVSYSNQIYSACQSTKKQFPKDYCPEGTLFVSKANRKADFETVQDAVMSLPNDTSARWILIDEGEYNEQVNVTRIGPTTLLGVTDDAKNYSANLATVWWSYGINQSVSPGQDDAFSSVLTIAPDLNGALIGSGYYGFSNSNIPVAFPSNKTGSVDFRTYNLNFQNRWANYSDGPALALGCSYSNCSFYATQFASYQDTVYVGHNGNAYFQKSEILGETDYMFGFGTAWFNDSLIGSRGCGGGITAWKGSNNYTNTFGAYFYGSSIVRSPDANATLDLTGLCALGRPWNNLSRVIYMDCYMDETINPKGFIEWSTSAPQLPPYGYYGEYNSYGPGWNYTARNQTIEKIYTDADIGEYSFRNVFHGIPEWIDYEF